MKLQIDVILRVPVTINWQGTRSGTGLGELATETTNAALTETYAGGYVDSMELTHLGDIPLPEPTKL